MEAKVAFVAMAADDRGGPGMRDTIATVPAEYGTSKGWRFNDCRATPGGAIIAGRLLPPRRPDHACPLTLLSTLRSRHVRSKTVAPSMESCDKSR